MDRDPNDLQIRRALLTVTDKTGIVELGQALAAVGAELVATGQTAKVLRDAGLKIIAIEKLSGSPEAFQGRMKTLSFPICSGILYRRTDVSDEKDVKKLSILPIDCVVANFYAFEKAAEKYLTPGKELIEEIDIGGPTLVRAAAKNAPSVLVLTDPKQYSAVIDDLNTRSRVSAKLAIQCAAQAWDCISAYDHAIALRLGESQSFPLRYGENPHQSGNLRVSRDSPIGWDEPLTPNALSYNNVLDVSSGYALASDLVALNAESTGVVILKHNNPCGVAVVSGTDERAQMRALELAWQGDPVSAFGGVVLFTHPIQSIASSWLAERFIELIAAPDLLPTSDGLKKILLKRKSLKALRIRKWGQIVKKQTFSVPGAELVQDSDFGIHEVLKTVTKKSWPENKESLRSEQPTYELKSP
ncbi:MAG: bifunctional phosphoribosylaminoimidazolecarboxamide formyltransferase/IMP cyclohydrolase PurH, partial [Bdellovibrionota bacterium]